VIADGFLHLSLKVFDDRGAFRRAPPRLVIQGVRRLHVFGNHRLQSLFIFIPNSDLDEAVEVDGVVGNRSQSSVAIDELALTA
jgi:hypothetical protein